MVYPHFHAHKELSHWPTITLHHTTGQPAIDRILQGIVELYNAVFPGYLRAYYLLGSYVGIFPQEAVQ